MRSIPGAVPHTPLRGGNISQICNVDPRKPKPVLQSCLQTYPVQAARSKSAWPSCVWLIYPGAYRQETRIYILRNPLRQGFRVRNSGKFGPFLSCEPSLEYLSGSLRLGLSLWISPYGPLSLPQVLLATHTRYSFPFTLV
ncbi:hypothetical protein M406DRAFT_355173 [Cryphonectria parasitica EP155]|uniref:Uncharacterized protein n=1 Tax=Cryphonectria parasitica (strain ATCC 38755 / EP155) TaxID=660469 RepID=A0A9P4Y9X8_CRYP1|nr:uncharacterized protein M406DRAFT_355173 [Cryphonectria parasitica EP155]KAF3769109.1 hypothetical protein M406DRAFT_355173 [Cryphonectria parasitica EP155]